jgi:hypothetical protein
MHGRQEVGFQYGIVVVLLIITAIPILQSRPL